MPILQMQEGEAWGPRGPSQPRCANANVMFKPPQIRPVSRSRHGSERRDSLTPNIYPLQQTFQTFHQLTHVLCLPACEMLWLIVPGRSVLSQPYR
jgi:hypothetical protein